MADMEIAKTILQQIGGRRFAAMTGSKNFVSDGNTLRMSLAKNATSANRLYITLEADDTYTMRFFRMTKGHFDKMYNWIDGKEKDISVLEGVYCDQLEDNFTLVTGLYTHF